MKLQVEIDVMQKKILDPDGKTVNPGLSNGGLKGVKDVRG